MQQAVSSKFYFFVVLVFAVVLEAAGFLAGFFAASDLEAAGFLAGCFASSDLEAAGFLAGAAASITAGAAAAGSSAAVSSISKSGATDFLNGFFFKFRLDRFRNDL